MRGVRGGRYRSDVLEAATLSTSRSEGVSVPGGRVVSERSIVWVVAAVQFVNILDFMMVMPLGPDLARALGISTAHIGLLGGSYTAAAALSGAVGSVVLDKFDRRTAICLAMVGLVLGTALGGLATGLYSLLAARVVAGVFGGPATSLALAIVADSVPVERRGRAVGTVMAAFSLASILGVPVGLELAARFDWRAPFFAVAALALLLTAAAWRILAPMRAHLGRAQPVTKARLTRLPILSLANTALVMFSVFAVVPNISAFLQHNIGYPREDLGLLYLAGGAASFVASRFVGSLVDHFGATRLVAIGTAMYVLALTLTFIYSVRVPHVIYLFPVLMTSATMRGVPLQTLASRVPEPDVRARFMSAQSTVQHLASAVGAGASAFFLDSQPDGKLVGMPVITIAAIVVAAFVPFGTFLLERGLRRRAAGAVAH
jgi:predicted MFS family arabinose efflux permease